MQKLDYKACYVNGYSFYNAAKQLGTVHVTNGNVSDLNIGWNVVPTIVNYAFAAELGLKAIIGNEKGDIPHIHKLDQLFTELPAAVRQLLLATVSNSLSVAEDEVSALIKSHSNTFTDWRYFAFNPKNISVDNVFLSKFCDAIYQYIGKELKL